ncbi:hypothetical protein IG631_20456 [Alternaria alternata]|nr:hypothetical protein IG631_20456 [Alternaria alternata]
MVVFDVLIVCDEESVGRAIVGVLCATNNVVDGLRDCCDVSLILGVILHRHPTLIPQKVVARYSPRISSIPAHGG